MKNLKKLSRESLRIFRGGITEQCARIQSSASYCVFKTQGQCSTADQEMFICVDACNKWCYY
ncbi:hypothetical protein ACMGDK_06855 [Chryseobacterium sp. DT-3]|uniref:hypothetical protein n=1 Tax=Chryseobacterium sp. DT-3 TaxID=3396164 RepID=UPI003F1A4F32